MRSAVQNGSIVHEQNKDMDVYDIVKGGGGGYLIGGLVLRDPTIGGIA